MSEVHNHEPAIAKGGASLLLSWNINRKHVLIVGGNYSAVQRTFFALEANAFVSIVSSYSALHPDLKLRLARDEITLIDRPFSPIDIEGKALVFSTLDDFSSAKHVSIVCRQRKIPINVSIAPELSDFHFVSTHRDNGLQIAISTNGNGPHLADKIRRQVAAKLNPHSGRAIQRISTLRQRVRAADVHGAASKRAEFINRVTDQWSLDKLANLSDHEIDVLVDHYLSGDEALPPFPVRNGTIKLVGGGPGEVKYLTVAAHSAIVDADLIIADSAISKEVRDLISGELHVVNASNFASSGDVLESIAKVALTALKFGKDVVRLVAGDPFLSGYGAEEYKLFHEYGYQPTVIPGLVSGPPKIYKGKVLPPTPTYKKHTPKVVEKVKSLGTLLPVVENPKQVKKVVEVSPPKHISIPATELTKIASSYHPIKQLSFGANYAVAQISYALSDIAFSFPVYPKATAGESLAQFSASHTKNAFGHTTKLVTMSIRVGTGSAVHGTLAAANGSLQASVVASSPALNVLIPTMHSIAKSKLSTVFHVASSQQVLSDSNFSLRVGHNDIISASNTGFAVVASTSLQESYDLALASHIVSAITHTPVLHFYDGAYIAREIAEINIASPEAIEAIAKFIAKQTSAKATEVTEAFDQVFHELAPAFGRTYAPFEYSGPAHPNSVIVTMGASAALAIAAVHKSKTVGVVNVRVYRPWNAKSLAHAIPTSVSKIVVVEENDVTAHSGLFMDVVAGLYSGAWTGKTPAVVKAKFDTTPQNFSVGALENLVNDLEKKKSGALQVVDKNPVTDGGILLWDLLEKKTSSVAVDVFKSLKGATKYIAHDVSKVHPVTVTQITHSKTPGLVRAADYVGVHDVSLLSNYNIAASVKQKGTIVVNAAWKTTADVEKDVPGSVRAELARKHVQLIAVDAEFFARNFTLFLGKHSDYVNSILSGVCFFVRNDVKALASLKSRVSESGANKNIIHTTLLAITRAIEKLVHITVPAYWTTATDVHTARLPHFVANSIVSDPVSVQDSEDDNDDALKATFKQKHFGYLPLMFKEAYGLTKTLRPDVHDSFQVTLTENARVTPDNYDRNVFHMEMDTTGTGMKYAIGEALGVHGHNDPVAVERFLHEYGTDKDEIVYIERTDTSGKPTVEVRNVNQVFVQLLDVFGKPGKKFFSAIATLATDPSERAHLFHLISAEGVDDLKRLGEEHTVTYADILIKFKSARPSVQTILNNGLIPQIKPRHYSIASSQNMHPDSVHLLVVLVDWTTPAGEYRTGQCTRYLSNLKVGQTLTVSVKPSVMKLPPSHEQPVIMAGLGTGMAPFRAFIEERAYQRSQGVTVGPMVLYFGSRHRAMEYLYGEELEAYAADGLLTSLRTAFSRDTNKKVYIQHLIKEDGEEVAEYLLKRKGAFYLCGPTWPVPDVRDALLDAFEHVGSWSRDKAAAELEELKEDERYVLE
ncbi:hypothetical protein HK096_002540, partial [Nowakowskiella sp. JEL0078]